MFLCGARSFVNAVIHITSYSNFWILMTFIAFYSNILTLYLLSRPSKVAAFAWVGEVVITSIIGAVVGNGVNSALAPQVIPGPFTLSSSNGISNGNGNGRKEEILDHLFIACEGELRGLPAQYLELLDDISSAGTSLEELGK